MRRCRLTEPALRDGALHARLATAQLHYGRTMGTHCVSTFSRKNHGNTNQDDLAIQVFWKLFLGAVAPHRGSSTRAAMVRGSWLGPLHLLS